LEVEYDMTLIEMKDVKKDYSLGETVVHALRGIDLEIDEGEFIGIWRPSGSGKTTLLNLIGAIDEPSAGHLAIAGKDIRSLSDNQKSEFRNDTIGYIFQSFNLVPVLSALENVMSPLQIKGTSFRKARDRALSSLGEVGLSEFISHRPAKMSGSSSGWPSQGHWSTAPHW
jgi:putative ABC transport system ATP-binding protein